MAATKEKELEGLTDALEDYLETIYELVRDQKLARVRDIARARGVRSGSVTPAMKRLADLGLIRYQQREYIDLTPAGEEQARRVYARHQMITRLFVELLGMAPRDAVKDACAMEHSLSPEGMDRLTRLLEFMALCPEGRELVRKFHCCPLVQHPEQNASCETCQCRPEDEPCADGREAEQTLVNLEPGQSAKVTHISGPPELRRNLLDMGILPDITVQLVRRAAKGGGVTVKIQGFELALDRKQARAVAIRS